MTCIYQTFNFGEAHLKAAVVDHPGQADLCVHRVSSRGLAHGEALWYICRDKQDADLWIWFGSVGQAQVKVCFVNSFGEAGWVSGHPLKGRLRRF